jgi:hypothetical protein
MNGGRCLLRREYDPAELLRSHPPVLRHPHKRLVFDLACPRGAAHAGRIELTRWGAASLPSRADLAPVQVALVPGYYDYAGDDAGVWHVNFADPSLFVAYGSPLLAQDELQAAEHPLLGCLREALKAEHQPALTEEDRAPTPVLVAGVERRCAIDTAPHPDRPGGLYGNRFAEATAETVRAAVRVIQPPTRTNLIAIAAPSGGWGTYRLEQLEGVEVTAATGFRGAVEESRRRWPGRPVEIRTGFWGCGAFGGNRVAMTLLQALAARLAGVDRIVFHAADDADAAREGLAALERVIAAGTPGESVSAILERVRELQYEWGESDGN